VLQLVTMQLEEQEQGQARAYDHLLSGLWREQGQQLEQLLLRWVGQGPQLARQLLQHARRMQLQWERQQRQGRER
jgi:hypothetical protein